LNWSIADDVSSAAASLGDVADQLQSTVERSGGTHPEAEEALQTYVTAIDELRRELEMDFLAG
jgi:hypothetical protein